MACAGACIAGASAGIAALSSTGVGAVILGALGLGYTGSRLLTKKRRRKSIPRKKGKKTLKRPSQRGGFQSYQSYQSSSTSSNTQQQTINGNIIELFMNEGLYQFNNQSNKNGSYIVRVTERGKSPKQRCFQTQSQAQKTFNKIVTYFSP